MRIQGIHSTTINTYKVPSAQSKNAGISFQSAADSFALSKPTREKTLKIFKEIKQIAAKNGIDSVNVNTALKKVNDTNCIVFKNLFDTALKENTLNRFFMASSLIACNVNAILNRTSEKNKDFAEYYTSLGGTNPAHFYESRKVLNKINTNLHLERFSTETIDEFFDNITEENFDLCSAIVNYSDVNDDELLEFVNSTYPYTPSERELTIKNLKAGFGDYFSKVASNHQHPLRKNLNTNDFYVKSPEFLSRFNYIAADKLYLFNLLKFPLKSYKNIEKTFREMASLMAKVSQNCNKAINEEQERKKCSAYFTSNFTDVFKMILLTDKETVLQILDKGFENSESFIRMQKNLKNSDMELLSTIVQRGKRINSHREYIDIPARDKVYVFNIININRNILAPSVGEINIKQAINKIDDGVLIDFKNIRTQIRNKVLTKYGFSDEEISNLSPQNIDWDARYVHLLAIPQGNNSTLKDIIQSASRGEFEKMIFSPNTKYGRNNQKTAEMFTNCRINYQDWLDGIPSQKFKIGEEELTVSLGKRRPQKSLFNGSKTNCCTALDGSQGKSMMEYLLSTTFNIAEVTDSKGNLIAQSRMFLVENFRPILIVDNIEVNNNFKKKLYNDNLKDQFIEGIFRYQRAFAKKLSDREIPIYFNQENNKLYNCGEVKGYAQEGLLVKNIIGTLNSEKTYCNLISGFFEDLPMSRVLVYDVTSPKIFNATFFV